MAVKVGRYKSGWFKVWRDAWDKDLSQHLALWGIWNALLHMATWKETQLIWEGKQRKLPPGSVVMGLRELADTWKISRMTVKKWLNYLHTSGRITLESGHHGSIITICNWDEYQADTREALTPTGRGLDAELTPTGRGLALIEEGKKVRTKDRPSHPVGALAQLSDSVTQGILATISDEVQSRWLEAYPNPEWIKREIKKANAWVATRKGKSLTSRFLTNWLARAEFPISASGTQPPVLRSIDELRAEQAAQNGDWFVTEEAGVSRA